MKIIFGRHALLRMKSRGIDSAEVEPEVQHGVVIEDDPTDTPYPVA